VRDRIRETQAALRRAGLRWTGPRLGVLGCLAAMPQHFSAEEALQAVARQKGTRTASRATVYRFLAELERLGILRKVQLAEGHSHYEFAPPREHCHLVCAQCGRVEEVQFPLLEQTVKRLAKQRGFRAQAPAIEITVNGCERCSGERTGTRNGAGKP